MLIAWISFVRLCVDINQKVAFLKRNEPPHDKTNNMACAPSEDSDQPWWMPRLICLRWAHSDFFFFFFLFVLFCFHEAAHPWGSLPI